MKKIYRMWILIAVFLTFTQVIGLAEEGMSPEKIQKKIQEVNAKPPAEIVALIPKSTKKTNLVFGPDYGARSYVRIEFNAEILNPDYHIHDRASLDLKCNLVDQKSQMAKMMYIQAYQAEQQNQMDQLTEEMNSNTDPLVKWEQVTNQYGKMFAWTQKYIEGGELGKNEKPHEEYYYNCTYISRTSGAFFEFTIRCLPLKSKDMVAQWFNELVVKLGKLDVVKLINY